MGKFEEVKKEVKGSEASWEGRQDTSPSVQETRK